MKKNKPLQSYLNLEKALKSLEKAVATPPVEERDYGGIIQAFESVYELTWKTLKKVLEVNGIDAPFPRVVFEEAFKRDMLEGNKIWLKISEDRNLSVHTYDQDMAIQLCKRIKDDYVVIFKQTVQKMKPFMNESK